MTLVLEGERQKSLCLGEQGTWFPGARGILKDKEFRDRVYYEDPHEETRERQGNWSLCGPLCYSAGRCGQAPFSPQPMLYALGVGCEDP